MATALPAAAAPRWRQGSDSPDFSDDSSYDFLLHDSRSSPASSSPRDGDPSTTHLPPLFTFRFRVLDTGFDGQPCTRTRWITGTTEAARGPATAVVRASELTYFRASRGTPAPACVAAPAVDPQAIVQQALQSVTGTLDAATPSVQPDNRAITGFRSHLRTGVDADRSRTVTVNLFGRDWDVEIDIDGVHTVDWGDGTVDHGLTGDGGDWHEGAPTSDDIVHHYLGVGTYQLVVTTDWSVTARLRGTDATASTTRTTRSAPVEVTVEEARSTRNP